MRAPMPRAPFTPERPISPGWLRAAGLVALGTLLTVFAWWPMFANYPKTPEEDGRYVYQQFEIAKASIRTYGELPLWNAFDCRGIPMWDYPESMIASPIVLLTVGLNTTITIILWNLIHVVGGFVGMWLFARHELKTTRGGAFVSATVWAFATGHVAQYAGEHETFVTFLFAPLLLLLWRRAERSWNAAVGLGILLALMLYEGATYPLPYSGIMLLAETLTRAYPPKRLPRILAAGGVAGGVAILLGASRLLPLVDQLTSHKREMYADVDALKPTSAWLMYTLRTPHWRATFNGQQYLFGEYITYIGWLGVFLLFVGVVTAGTEYLWMVAVGAMLFAVMAGHWGKWAPWTFLHEHVFPFKSMRVPARFRHLLMALVAAFIGLGVDKVPVRLRELGAGRRLADASRVVMFGLAFVVAGDMIGLGLDILGYRFNGAPPAKVTRSTRFYYGGPGLAGDFIDHPRQNRAWLGCRAYEWAFRADAPLWTGDVPQARAVDDAVVVEVANRTHNTFTIDAVASRPGRIHLNSAYDKSWQSDVGAVVEDQKLLAIDLPPGRHRIHVKYWPRFLTLGFSLSALGLIGVTAFFFRRRLRALVLRSGAPRA